ncbi:hypothetical protein BC832DRAFT_588280 [Gaertneriomyces semiglobifer]|nr:hypothetical protein BC832DRAFT_588280 [Gaertneriomyces semiglobifer]
MTKPLIFYDISSPLQPRSYAPNPSKARLALSFKQVPFKTTWVDLPDITAVRKGLNCPAMRQLDDGTDFYTLPMVVDPNANNKVLGDSFDIANYLDATFPDSGGLLFPTDTTRTGLDYESPHKDTPFIVPLTVLASTTPNVEYANFNRHVDATFTMHTVLVGEFLPFNPQSAETVKATMAKRAHVQNWDDLFAGARDKATRGKMLEAFKGALESLARLFMVHPSGPYLEGEKANYADLIVGGWVNMMAMTMPEEEWKQFRTWHGGVFGKLHDALQKNYYVCT